MPLMCRRLNLSGVADIVEFRAGVDGETAYPVEYKRGKAKLHRADEVQLCAQPRLRCCGRSTRSLL